MSLRELLLVGGCALLLAAVFALGVRARPTPAEAVVSTIEETMPLPPSQIPGSTISASENLDLGVVQCTSPDAAATELLEKLSTDPIHHAQHAHRLKYLLPQVSDTTLVSIARSPVVAWVPLIEATNREISCRLLLRLPPP